MRTHDIQDHPATPVTSATSSIEQVRQRSRRWIADFNRGDVDACVAAYQPDATMDARPMGSFRGAEQIAGFWRPFVASGAGQLEYRNVSLEARGERTVLLSADWSMNVGSGVITEERWVKQDDGRWLLAHDAFEVLQRT